MENPAKLREYLERVTLDLRRAHRRIEDLEQQEGEPIAIVGMSCRYPGGVSSPEELWQLAAGGRDGITEFPANRGWDLERLYDPEIEGDGSRLTSYTREGGFLHDSADFDAEFFAISPREALATDPQQRLLLEASWQALEDAGIDPRDLAQTQTGVFAGVMYQDYGEAAGMTQSLVSGRVAYTLGLEGPAITVDTACSSSLVAMHWAAQSLRSGECSLALAGGVTVLSAPGVFVEFSRQRGLAPDGRSKSFAEAADGVGWAEGVGMLALERLSDAERQGHEILAILKGSAVNQDGASNGLTAPNGPSQERVIRQALANARLEPKDIDAVEAHGTGTTLGDPIEAGALLATYGQERDEPLRLGSIKSNIGHTQAAAGVAGVIKMVQAMRHGVLPKTLHVDKPSSKVDWEAGEVELLTEEIPWQPNGKPRRAGVSSFGISGTNAHVILEEAPAPQEIEVGEEAVKPEPPLSGVIALPLSAKTEPALREAAANLAIHLKDNPELDPEDVAFSLATTRALFERRGVIVGSGREELLSGLRALSKGEPAANAFEAKAKSGKLAYLLTGQGAQRAAMGKELYEASPAFAKALDEACEAIDPHLEHPLKELLFAKEGSKQAALLDDTTFTQPALFAIEAALFRLTEQLGMSPDYLTGHSVGEISAAHISGVLSLADAAKLITARAKLMGELPKGGAMVAIEATEQEVREAIEGKEKELSIAAVNGPTAIVISGVEKAALEVQADFEGQGKKTKRLSVSHAFHSPLIEPMLEEFAKVTESLEYNPPQIPIVSNTSGEILTEEQAQDPAYWVSHVREAVRFAAGIETLQGQGVTTFVELGPDAVLSAMAASCLPEGSEATLIPTLRKGRGEAEALSAAIAQAHSAGASLDWAKLYPGAKRVPLPTYPFQRERYWLSSAFGPTDASSIGQGALDHPLLAARVEDPGAERLTLTGRISLSTHPWLADHAVLGTVILPGTAFVELALKAAEEVGCEAIGELTLQAPLLLSEQGAVSLQVSVAETDEQGERPISIHSRSEAGEEEGEWVTHATGSLIPQAPAAPEPLTVWPPEGAEPIDTSGFYERLAEVGFDYGPAFQGLSAAWQDGEQIYAEVELAEAQREQAGRFAIHPALFDSAFHVSLAIGLTGEGEGAKPILPFDWRGVRVLGPGASSLRVRLSIQKGSLGLLAGDPSGNPVVEIGSLYGRPVEQGQLATQSRQGSLYRLDWQETPLPDVSEASAGEIPDVTLLDTCSWAQDPDPVAGSHATAAKALEQIQAHLAKEEDQQSRLVFLTEGALSTAETEEPDLPAATLAGLLRSAHSEHPGHFALIDTDGTDASSKAIEAAIAASLEEPQIALREGEALVPRLAEAEGDTEAEGAPTFDPEKTVLITGATGGLGALFARHLAEHHGARHLLLASRSGEKAAGAKELQAELEELGAKATIAACDVSDRKALEKLLSSIPPEHPLGAVIHTAGVLDNGLIADLDPERLSAVMAPKADASHHLHELTRDLDLSHFVLFSSAAGLLGGPGQGNYAAANSFLDALAAKRRGLDLPATSLAWGFWAQEGNLVGELGEAEIEQFLRQTRMLLGFAPIPAEQGLELFEQTSASSDSVLAPVHFDRAALRAQAKAGSLPALMRGLVRVPKGRESSGGSFAAQLATVPETDRGSFVLEFVRGHVAAVLGHDSVDAIDPERAFKDLGFDSLAAVELRNRLVEATAVRLPATMAFDYPSAAALARYLLAEVSASGSAPKAIARAQASEEPIAIVGMSCRYPGEASSPEGLWRLVAEGRDAIEAFPTDRGWDLERLYDPDPDSPGTCYAREAGFVADSAEFDAEFFGISPREALAMDPQQRLLLEASWQALEDAGVDPRTLHETQTGVFAGVMYQDYGEAAGMTQSLVSGRIAYTLGLEGPAMTVDTACSSSLVAMHLAAQALRSGECSLALAGGVTVLSTPGMLVYFSRQRGLSPDGRSKSFAEAADGAGWAEGVGVLALQRLSDARRDGHKVLAILKGSAVNQDGASNGLTAPNGPSQERVIRQALANARLEPKDIDAVEAHGTGTTLGDPIEAGALLATYGQDRDEPLKLGSIKSNIGHTQAAAGVAGVIKMVQAMRHGVLPKTLHVDKPSSKVDWEAGEVELLTEEIPWQPNGKPRRAGVSSFGASGTNAHVIIEEAPAPQEIEAGEEQETPKPPLQGTIALPLSAKTEPALREAAANLATHLSENPELDPEDVAFSLATTRALFERRGVVTGESREELLSGLKALSKGEPAANAFEAKAKSGKLAYLLTGQGAQRAAMGKELYGASPAFAKALDEACEAIDPHLEHPLKELLFAKEGSKQAALLDDTTFTQPALFAIEAALFRLTEQLGMSPDYLTGHSVGQISAAHISGVLSLTDAAKLITARAKLMGELPKGGAMVAIEATEQEVREAIEGKEKELSIAAVNGPTAIVISGVEKAALEVQADFEGQGKKTKRLSVSHAFHSPLIEPMLAEFAKVTESLEYNPPQIPIVSNTSGEILTEEQAQDPAYWVSHVREAVRFAAGIETLQGQGVTTFVELGPDAVLSAMAASCLPEGSEATLIPTLRKGRGEAEALSGAVAQAHSAGAKLDWARLYPGAKRVPLPTYPFQRERFWLSSAFGPTDAASIGQGALDHPLLAARVEDPGAERLTLTGRISLSTHPWLADHAVLGSVILPGTAFVEMALKAAEEVGCKAIGELTLQAPLMLSEQGAVSLQVSVAEAGEQGERQVSIHSRSEAGEEEGEWVTHATGSLTPQAPAAPEPLTAWPPEGAEPVETDDLYERLAEVGFDYGPAFQGLSAAWRDGEQIYAEVELAEEQREQARRFAIHPALLDSAFHAILDPALSGGGEQPSAPVVPFSWSGVGLEATGASSLRLRVTREEERTALLGVDGTGAAVVQVESVIGRPLDQGQLATQSRQGSLYRLDWKEISLPEAGESEATLLDTRDWAQAEDPVAASHATAAKALEQIQANLAEEEESQSRLVFLTEGALSTDEAGNPSLPAATLAGLLRSAHAEHPGRFALIDTDGTDASSKAIEAAIAASLEEPQIALRAGEALVPRLAEAKGDTEAEGIPTFDPEKTILITGATGGLGALFARHLAETHGARNLLLVSRSGEKAAGATELQAELEELGAETTIAACDVSDPEALKKLLGSIPQKHPLGAVIHSAGVLDDGVVEALDAERIDRVMAPKADAAHHLHELTRDLDLSHFVLFSSIAGPLGGPGQGNYAAANSFLDALAAKRRRQGLPATSIAWGLWERESTMTAGLGEADLARMRRGGIAPITDEQGLAFFDAAIHVPFAQTLAVTLNRAGLRSQAAAGALPAIFSGLVRGAGRRKAGSGQLAAKLAALPEAEHEAAVLGAVRAEVAAVLGHDSAAAIEPERAFKDLGFDSLAAVELRNRLGATTGISLPATMAFDYPSSAALARYLLVEVGASGATRKTVARAQASEEPVAIVGMSCRYPGDASSPEELWELVAEGRDGISEFPANRGWDLERLYDPEIGGDGSRLTSYTREGGFVADSAEFDAEFFAISPREALAMDPQQRLLLEASWQALEDAGIDPRALARTQTGVFAGVMYQDYGEAAGMSQSLVSGRIAYTLGLEGPAITVDTACSSSLVAMHWAAQSLRSGECSLALAGGVTVLSTPGAFIEFSRQRGLAPDGRSKSFSEAADGVGWAEGVGVLALERLSDAKRNGHEILAILKGSAVNQDGASNGLTAPNGPSQERVIRQALANARLEPKDIDAVEAHGTGTTLGDPIEAGALLATYGQERDEPLRLGSIKSNIGHTQAAAGVAGVIKMVQAMRHGVLPKTLHVDKPSSKVDWEAGEVELLTEEIPWQPNGKPRRAGVSSFGISGTNAHVILEEAPAPQEIEAGGEQETPEPPLQGTIALPLSAKTEPALQEAAANLTTHLEDNPELDPEDVAFSLATTRALFERRGVIVGSGREELLSGLRALSKGEPAANAFEAKAKSGKLAYLLTGQGAQRAAMGKELYEASPAFAKALDEACEAIDPHLEHPLKELLFAKEGSKQAALLDDTTFTQPALFAIESALFRLTEQLGMSPDYLTGHSVGEISAAHISGVLSLKDAAKLITARAKLMGELPKGGAMVAIEATEQEVREAIEGKEKELSIAAVNGPTAIVISGVEKAALEVQADFEGQGKKTKRLSVSHAFHSPLIEPMLEEFAKVTESLEYNPPQIPIVSNTSGEILTEEQAQDPAYWVSHVREAVRFAAGIETLQGQGVTTFVELGPDAVLSPMAASCLPEGSEATLIPTLRKGRGEAEALSGAIAQAHAAGAKLDWARLYPGAKRVPLPTYPFQRERYWLSSTHGPTDASSIGQGALDHPLLAAKVEDPDGGRLTLTGRISLSTHPWLADHAVLGTVILPGTAFVEMALKAAEEVGCEAVAELTLQAPLILSEQGAVSIQVSVAEAGEQGERSISIHSRSEAGEEEGEWVTHATGSLTPQAPAAPEPLTVWPPEAAEPIDTSGFYERLAEVGFDYGPAFQGLSAAWQDGEQIYAEVELAEAQREQAGRFAIHPALFDSAFHAGLAVGLSGEEEGAKPTLPFDWHGVRVHGAGVSSLRVRLSIQEGSLGLLAGDPSGNPVVEIGSLYGRPVEQGQLATQSRQGSIYRLDWQELSLPGTGGSEATLLDTRAWAEDSDPVKASHAAAAKALEQIQVHLAKEDDRQSRLVFLTAGALSTAEADAPELPAATLAGLLRSAYAEHPGRFALIDTDGSDASGKATEAAIVASLEEPQIALRGGGAFVPRLTEAKVDTETEDALTFDPEKTILITGATGGLGALLARHLAEAHGARNLLLVSRSGEKAEGAKELQAELEELGAKATIAACDVSDRRALEKLLASIPREHPLGAVIHAAGVFDNGLIGDLDPERLSGVLAPKADASHHLHELTADLDLDAFVLFSSAAGLLGGPGQGNYAAANSFLDALAAKRRAQNLPGTSLAWGLWAQESNLIGEAEIEQLLRQTRMLLGFAPMPPEQGLELFEAAISHAEPLLAPVYFDRAALRAQAKAGSLPALMRGLVRVRRTVQRERGWLLPSLAPLAEEERRQALEEALGAQIASSLGQTSPENVEPGLTFPELGFDSLASLEMRDWLSLATGLSLPASVLFDYPTIEALSQYVDQQLDAVPWRAGAQSAQPASAGIGDRGQKAGELVSIGSLYERAEALGRSDEGAALLTIAASLRQTFDPDTHMEHVPGHVQLSTGSESPKLICVPSLLAVGGPHQYVKFAQYFTGKRNVDVVPNPGFLEGEQLPADLQVAKMTQAAAIQQCADGAPYVLVGHSTGGLFAHVIAEYLDGIGMPPDGVVKVDTYSHAGLADITPHALSGMKEREGSHFELTDHRLTAMVAYRRLLEECDPGAINSAGLFVKATDPMPGMTEDGMRQARWDGAQAVMDVPGNHFTMMEEHVSHVAQAVDEWLSKLTNKGNF